MGLGGDNSPVDTATRAIYLPLVLVGDEQSEDVAQPERVYVTISGTHVSPRVLANLISLSRGM